MNELQIDYFLAVARNLSFTKTADEMYVSQPAISRQISHLEGELGFVLFDRSKKSTQLTAAGKLYYDFFSEFKQNMQKTRDMAYKSTNEQVGSIRIACLEGWNNVTCIPEALNNFKSNFKNMDIELSSYGFKGLLKALGADKVDVILSLEGTLEDYDDIMRKTVTKVPKKIIFSKMHRFANRVNLSPKDFKDEKFFIPVPEESKYAESRIKSYCRNQGFVPNIEMAANIESMILNVRNGLGVAIMDDWTIASAGGEFLSVDLGMTDDVILAWKETNLNPAIGVLVSEMLFILNDEAKV
ncbi:LysR family transcriptional regulator [Aminicella lysinilytica]|uniref:LysR family transcriptional regulator n=1 Tax=Aminicella lysinilytica TaxID=433323 RepID=UPI0026ED0B67|nr:LysR family transcriptional regulator [Aminicella lysinilytica]